MTGLVVHKHLFPLPAIVVFVAATLPAPPALSQSELVQAPLTLVGLLHDDRALSRPHDVELQGDIAYVPGKGGSLAIIDVSDPAQPRLLSSMVDPVGLEDAETILPMGDILLLGTRDFLAIDVSDPRRPVIKKRISDRPRIDRINGIALRGSFAFTANKSGYVTVFDVSDPAEPKLHDVLDAKTHGALQSPHDIAVTGYRIVVVNASHTGPTHVQMYRVADDLQVVRTLGIQQRFVELDLVDTRLVEPSLRTGTTPKSQRRTMTGNNPDAMNAGVRVS